MTTTICVWLWVSFPLGKTKVTYLSYEQSTVGLISIHFIGQIHYQLHRLEIRSAEEVIRTIAVFTWRHWSHDHWIHNIWLATDDPMKPSHSCWDIMRETFAQAHSHWKCIGLQLHCTEAKYGYSIFKQQAYNGRRDTSFELLTVNSGPQATILLGSDLAIENASGEKLGQNKEKDVGFTLPMNSTLLFWSQMTVKIYNKSTKNCGRSSVGRQTDASDLTIHPTLCYSNDTQIWTKYTITQTLATKPSPTSMFCTFKSPCMTGCGCTECRYSIP